MHPEFSSTPPPPHKTSPVTSLSAKTSPLLCVGAGDRKSRTEKQRTRGGGTEREVEEWDTID